MSLQTAPNVRFELAMELLESIGSMQCVARGASMLPTVFPGDKLEIRSRRFDELSTGDVIVAMNRAGFYAHRVVRQEFQTGRRVLITRGDSLPSEDPDPVREEDFLGSVEFIVRRGRRFRPETEDDGLRSACRMALRHSSVLRNHVLRFHALLNRVTQRTNNVRFGTMISGDVA